MERETILINKDGYIRSPYIKDANIEIELDKETFEKICVCKIGYTWKYDFETKKFNEVIEECQPNVYKQLRKIQCFEIIDNRSQLWYNHLTEQQKQELDAWYQAWLDVTETKIIPEKPEWL